MKAVLIKPHRIDGDAVKRCYPSFNLINTTKYNITAGLHDIWDNYQSDFFGLVILAWMSYWVAGVSRQVS